MSVNVEKNNFLYDTEMKLHDTTILIICHKQVKTRQENGFSQNIMLTSAILTF